MKRQVKALTWMMVAVLSACGGGGGNEDAPASGPTPAQFALPSHQAATLALAATTTEAVAARTVAATSLLLRISVGMASYFNQVSPAHPVWSIACGGGGSWTITFTDADGSHSVSPGDLISQDTPNCRASIIEDGRMVATVRAADANGFTDLDVQIDGRSSFVGGGTWVPQIAGTVRLSLHEGGYWVRSDTGLRMQANPDNWIELSRIGVQVPSPSTLLTQGGFDMTIRSAGVGEGRVQFDMVDGSVKYLATPNLPPSPGTYALKGASNTSMLIGDAAPASPGSFRVRTDGSGNGTYDDDRVIPSSGIFASL
jgi:hypothetical protein